MRLDGLPTTLPLTANHNLSASAFPVSNLTDTTSAREEEQPGQPGAGYRDCSWGE